MTKKKRSDKYEKKLSIDGSLDEVLGLSAQPLKKESKTHKAKKTNKKKK